MSLVGGGPGKGRKVKGGIRRPSSSPPPDKNRKTRMKKRGEGGRKAVVGGREGGGENLVPAKTSRRIGNSGWF